MSIFSELGVREGKDRLKEEVLYNLAVCYLLAEQRIARTLAPFGLSTVKMNALLIIRHVGQLKGIAQGDLAKRMIVSAGNITHLIDRLEKEKLVERVLRPGDRRVKSIRITEKGSDALDRAWHPHKKEVSAIVSLIPDSDIPKTRNILNQWRERLLKCKD